MFKFNLFKKEKNIIIKGIKMLKKGTGKFLITLGSTTADDKIITSTCEVTILTGEKTYLGSTPITQEMLDIAFKKAFDIINKEQIKIGTKLSS